MQDDRFDRTGSITVCGVTSNGSEAPLFRLSVEPNERNGLQAASRLMTDKLTTVPKSKIGRKIGRLDDEDVMRLSRAMLVFLGRAVSPREARRSV